jgi:outer membrane lipoprotein-sorting protein
MRILTGPLLLFSLLVVPARAADASLDQVLAAMDKTAASFSDMSAKLTRVDYTAVINDTSKESGVVRMKRVGPRDIRMRIDFSEPDPRTIVFEKAAAQIYYPKIRTVQVYDLGKQRSLVDQFLLLGFGSSGKELSRNYTLKVTGEERISGQPATRLELVPKAASVLEYIKKAELWISAAGYPLQQRFDRPSGDYTLITYSDVQINTGAPDSAFKLNLPKGVKTEYPQK